MVIKKINTVDKLFSLRIIIFLVGLFAFEIATIIKQPPTTTWNYQTNKVKLIYLCLLSR